MPGRQDSNFFLIFRIKFFLMLSIFFYASAQVGGNTVRGALTENSARDSYAMGALRWWRHGSRIRGFASVLRSRGMKFRLSVLHESLGPQM